MITANASQYVLNALLALIEGKSVFTAHDVKVAARAKTNADGSDEFIDHEEVRNIVHTEYSTGEFPDEYNKEEFLALTNGHTAICYYPDGKTAEDHPMAVQGQTAAASQTTTSTTSPAQAVSQSAAPTTKQGGSVKDGNGFICTETSKGVINIPDVIVKAATKSGDTYDISINGGTVIYKAPDGQGRLRIASSKLGGVSPFRMEVTAAGVIVIVQA